MKRMMLLLAMVLMTGCVFVEDGQEPTDEPEADGGVGGDSSCQPCDHCAPGDTTPPTIPPTLPPSACAGVCGDHGTCVDAKVGCVANNGFLSCDSNELEGMCAADYNDPNNLGFCCIAVSDQDCQGSKACKNEGQCSATPQGNCRPASDDDCEQSKLCEDQGRCSVCECWPGSTEMCCCW